MGSGYQPQRTGVEGLARKFDDLQRQLDALRGAAGLTSAVISRGGVTTYDPDSGQRTFMGNGIIYLTPPGLDFDDPGQTLQHAATIWANNEDDDARLVLRPPAPDLSRMGGQLELMSGLPGNWPNGMFELSSGSEGRITTPSLLIELLNFDTLAEGELIISSLPTTGSSANLRLDPTFSTVARSTSSRRYKQDIEDAEVDPADVLALRSRTWRDRREVERDADTDHRIVGFVAEELDEHPTLKQFVEYDAEGRPDAIQYDRLSVALVELAKDQEQRLADLEQRVAALEGK